MNAIGRWVLYDGECGFCRAAVDALRPRLERNGFKFAPLQSDWVTEQLGLKPEDLLTEMRVVKSDGAMLGGAEAVIYLGTFFWWGWMLRVVAKLPGGDTWLQRGYAWVAERRGCVNGTCSVVKRVGWAGWTPVVALPMLAMAAAGRMEPWILMWAIAIALFAGCKWLTWWEAFINGRAGRRSLAYLTRWVGMDARTFMEEKKRPLRVRTGQWVFAGTKTTLGAVTVWGMARLISDGNALWQGWVAMVGGIFFLHFGVFHLLALEWQRRGVMAEPIMDAPILAKSLGEFWGRRWNRGFNDLVRRYSFYPLVPRLGVGGAMLFTFFVSGLIHDLVISIPARTGYRLPTAYFLLQGFGVLLEKSRPGRRLGLRRGVGGRLFVYLFTVGPVGMLFFPRFVEGVVLPFLKFIHAL